MSNPENNKNRFNIYKFLLGVSLPFAIAGAYLLPKEFEKVNIPTPAVKVAPKTLEQELEWLIKEHPTLYIGYKSSMSRMERGDFSTYFTIRGKLYKFRAIEIMYYFEKKYNECKLQTKWDEICEVIEKGYIGYTSTAEIFIIENNLPITYYENLVKITKEDKETPEGDKKALKDLNGALNAYEKNRWENEETEHFPSDSRMKFNF